MEIDTQLARQLASSDPTDAQFRLLVESVTEYAIYLLDPSGRGMSWNAGAERIKGYAAAEILGRRDQEIFPAEQAARFAKSDAEVLAKRAAVELEQPAVTTEGERLLMVVKFPVFDADGGVAGIGGIASDITDRKRSEQALVEQRTLLAEAQKVAGLGCWEWEPGTGRMTWSEELYRIFGVAGKDPQPTFEAYLERVHPADRVLTATALARALAEGRGFIQEERIVRPGGSERVIRTHGEIVRDGGGRVANLVRRRLDLSETPNARITQRAAAASLQSLTRRLVQVEEAERRRIAGELHDRVGQNLSALNINLDIVLGALGDGADPDLRLRLRDSLGLVDGTLQTIAAVMADLRPPLLEEYGLGAALAWYAEEFAKRTAITIEVDDLAP